MGQCSTKKKVPGPGDRAHRQRPSVLKSSDPLHFQVCVKSVGLRGVDSVSAIQDTYYLDLKWGTNQKKTEKRTGSDVKWQSEWTFPVLATPNWLQTQYFVVNVWQVEGGKPAAVVKIPLWEIVVGPQSQSFQIVGSKGKTLGRLEADIKVLQVTKLYLRALRIQAEFVEPQYSKFSLSLKYAGEGNQDTKHSDISDTPEWTTDKLKQLTFSRSVTVNTFRTVALQFRLYKHSSKSDSPTTMFAECWIGLIRLVKRMQGSGEFVTPVRKDSYPDLPLPSDNREVQTEFEGTLWHYGRQMGTISGAFGVSGVPFISQLRAGVNTEDGYKIQNTEFLHRQRDKTYRPQQVPHQMVQMEVLGRQLREYVRTNRDSVTLLGGNQAHLTHATMLLYELKETEVDTMIAHVYSNDSELLSAQNLLLGLGEFLLEYAESVSYEVRSLYYECLSHLVKRGEADLGHLALSGSWSAEVKEQKLATGVRYWAFIKQLLGRALGKLQEKAADARTLEFSAVVMALAYFRLTSFREQVLDALKEKSYSEVSEWRKTTYDLEEEVPAHPWSLPILDWDQYFCCHLPADDSDAEFARVLADSSWCRRLGKRGPAYFVFLSEWVSIVCRLFGNKQIPWHEIPGYNVLIKSFLLELKSRAIRQYPEALLKACLSLLANQHLISVFILILFQKTNVYDVECVRETMVNTCNWLTALFEAGVPLPVTFPNEFFAQGLCIALHSDIMLNVSNVIWLLYKVYHCLHPETKNDFVLSTVLGSSAHRLMFHWSHTVRQIYWSFVCYRLLSMKSIPILPLSSVDSDTIKQAEAIVEFALNAGEVEAVQSEFRPYVRQSKDQLQAVLKTYEVWLAGKKKESAQNNKGKYGTFTVFPYPEVVLQKAFEDPMERKLDED